MNFTLPTHSTIHFTPLTAQQPRLKAIGVGGAGSNAINRMIELGLSNIEFIVANTDAQALQHTLAPTRIQLGPHRTRGLGAGGNPDIGEAAAEESYIPLTKALDGADMVFIAAGMGGGTGTGAAAVVARAAHSVGAITVSVVTTPFSFEVGRRQANARAGLARLRAHSDTLITIPNDRLLSLAGRNLTLEMAFRLADDVLRQGIQGISELITEPGLINIDFAHIQQLIKTGGGALLSIGIGEGPNKVEKAIERALHHPLLDTLQIEEATAILVNITASQDITFIEVMNALSTLQDQAGQCVEIIPGLMTDERLQDRAQVILILTGLGATPISTNAATPTIAAQPLPGTIAPSPAIPLQSFANTPELQPVSAPNDLDLPAFLRRRTRH